MRSSILIAGLICAAAWALPPAFAATAHSTGHASAHVVGEKLRILSKTPLYFGYILPGSKAGTVTVTPKNSRNSTGKVKLFPGGYEHATFLIEGNRNRSYSIHTPSSLTINGTPIPPIMPPGSTKTLQVTDFKTYSNNTRSSANTGRLNVVGLDLIFLGATLQVPNNVAPGYYVANVPLTVSY